MSGAITDAFEDLEHIQRLLNAAALAAGAIKGDDPIEAVVELIEVARSSTMVAMGRLENAMGRGTISTPTQDFARDIADVDEGLHEVSAALTLLDMAAKALPVHEGKAMAAGIECASQALRITREDFCYFAQARKLRAEQIGGAA